MRTVWGLLLAAGMLVGAGCSPLVKQTPGSAVVGKVSDAALAAEHQRQDWLFGHGDWSFDGRAAISRGDKGGSGRVDWLQHGTGYQIQLSAPVTRQSWTLSGDSRDGGGRLDGLEGGPRAGADAEQLLLEAVGWDIPVNLLPAWVRGLVAEDAAVPERVDRDADGRLRTLVQMGWTIDFLDWYPPVDGKPALPRRIDARNGDAKVRLLLDNWSFQTP